MFAKLLDYVIHIDVKLGAIINHYGHWGYAILFAIIFLETGVVFMPFLPGDSLLFAAGAFASKGFFDPILLFVLLSIAAIAGDATNYWIGSHIGKRIENSQNPFISKDYLMRTQDFYNKHGKKTIIFARFLPILRTFAPFVAGIAKMRYSEFVSYNVIGGIAWVGLFVFGGYFFGNIPVVERNFTYVILAIVAISTAPAVFEFWKHRRRRKA